MQINLYRQGLRRLPLIAGRYTFSDGAVHYDLQRRERRLRGKAQSA